MQQNSLCLLRVFFLSNTANILDTKYTKVLLANGETVADDELLSVTYYNIYGQPIQVISDNHLGGKDIISSKVNFTGDVLKTVEQHIANGEEIEIIQNFTYDHGKRLIETIHQINEEDEVVVSIQKYNELGHLSHKKLHGALQQIDYDYNIRGWLTGINNPNSLDNDLFAMQLDYETGTNPQFNGNISSVIWSSEFYDGLKQYEFEYDGLNRLTNANYADDNKYTTSYSYDANGNIETLSRNMDINGIAEPIDQLIYDYGITGNQLLSVNDGTGSNFENFGFKDNGIDNAIEYLYDDNGNMYKDENKGIEKITYNHLNLPISIQFKDDNDESKSIGYIYTANGNKLRKHTHDGSKESTTTDYIGAFVYETTNDLELQFIQTSEGRLVPDESGGYNYEYALKDHLGNTRVMFKEAGKVIQDQSYYPFGMSLGNELTYHNTDDSPKNKYLYNGKELQADFDLGWYDYGARFYDPQIGRWNVVDPKSEIAMRWTPYQYAYSNPIRFIDPDGMVVRSHGYNNQYFWDVNGNGSYDTGEGDPGENNKDLVGAITRLLTGTTTTSDIPDNVDVPENTKNISETVGKVKDGTVIAEAVTEISKDVARGTADVLEVTGTVVKGTGYVAAPFTGGNSLLLVPVGEGIESVGTAINFGLDLNDGNYSSAGCTLLTSALFGMLGKQLNQMEKAGEITKNEKGLANFTKEKYNQAANYIKKKTIDNEND